MLVHGPGGGNTLLFSYVYEDFVDIFLGSSQNWTSFRSHFYAFKGPFIRSWYRMGIFLWVAKISNIFLGWLIFLIFFGVNSRWWVQAYV